jgi:pimeloyl-ACP methyl ester carboxylesterase
MLPGVVGMADRVRDLHVPVTIMAGTKDRIIDHESHAKWFQEQMPGSDLRLVPGAGHMFHYAVPDQVVEVIEDVSSRGRGIDGAAPIRAGRLESSERG